MADIGFNHATSWRVQLILQFYAADEGRGPFSVWRVQDNVRTLVRGTDGLVPPAYDGSPFTVWDTEPPLNVALDYAIVDADGSVMVRASTWLGFVTVAADRPVISDPVTGAAAEVTVMSMGDSEIANQGKRLEVAGRRSPVWVTGTEQLPSRTIDLLTMTAAEDARLSALLDNGRPLLLRLSCADLPWPVMWFVIESRSWAKFSRSRQSQVLRHRLNVTEVDQPWPDELAVGQTLGDLHAYAMRRGGTLSVIAEDFGMLWDIDIADLRAML